MNLDLTAIAAADYKRKHLKPHLIAEERTVPTAATDWLYVVVQNPDSDAQIMGQHDEAHDIRFIPAFRTKEDAQQGLLQLPTARGVKYEVQAMIIEDLRRYASEMGSLIFLLDADGRILEKLAPAG
jgi:hypothetical protein